MFFVVIHKSTAPTTTTTIFIYIIYTIYRNLTINNCELFWRLFMIFICEKQKLQEGILIVQKAITGKSTMPILEMVFT